MNSVEDATLQLLQRMDEGEVSSFNDLPVLSGCNLEI